MADNPTKRKSSRARIPIQRLGEVVDTTKLRKTSKRKLVREMEGNASVATTSTSRGTIKKSRIDLDTQEEIARLDHEFREKHKALKLMEVEENRISTVIRTLRDEIDSMKENNAQEREIQDKRVELAATEKVISDLQNTLAIKEVELRADQEELEDKKKLLLQRSQVEKDQVELEEEEQRNRNSPLPTSLSDKLERTAIWAGSAKSQNEGRKTNSKRPPDNDEDSEQELDQSTSDSSQEIDSEEESESDEMEKLYQRFRKIKMDPAPSPMEAMAEAITKAITAAIPSSKNTSKGSEKFLARQVQGKDLPTFTGKVEEWSIFILCSSHPPNPVNTQMKKTSFGYSAALKEKPLRQSIVFYPNHQMSQQQLKCWRKDLVSRSQSSTASSSR